MASIRDNLAVQCQIDTVSFWAVAASGGGTRRIAKYVGIGVDGADTEDLGEDARTEQIRAVLDEAQYLEIEGIRRAAAVVDIVHPLFGSFRGRVVSITYQAGIRDSVDCTITVVEHGEHVAQMAPVVITLPNAAQQAKSLGGDLMGDLDDLDGLADIPSGLPTAATGMQAGWSDFDDLLDDALTGDVGFAALGAGLADIGAAVQELQDQYDAAVNTVTDLAANPLPDVALELMDACRDCVDAARAEISEVSRTFRAMGPVSLADLALEFLGSDDEAAIDAILAHNPEILDVNVVPKGIEISIPLAS